MSSLKSGGNGLVNLGIDSSGSSQRPSNENEQTLSHSANRPEGGARDYRD